MALCIALIPIVLWWYGFGFQGYLVLPLGLLSALESAASALAFGRVRAPLIGSRLDNLPRALVGAGTLLGLVVLYASNAPVRSIMVVGTGLIAGMAVAITRPQLGSRLTGNLDRVAAWSGVEVARLLTLIMLGPIIVLVWVVHRALSFDPLRVPTAAGEGWLRRRNGGTELFRLYAVITPAEPVTTPQRMHRGLAGVGVFCVLCALVVLSVGLVPKIGTLKDRLSPRDPFQPAEPAQSAAASEEPWFDELSSDLGNARFNWRTTSEFLTQDVTSPTVNIIDGERRTWAPPACDCPRLNVWIFGGSSVFGYWQRDGHTIASEIARAAWDDGIALDVSNFGQPAYTLWQDVGRLSELLATKEELPDIVLFMDGANEFGVQVDRNKAGYGTDESPASALDNPMRTLFPQALGILNWLAPGQSNPDDKGPDAHLNPEEVAGHAVTRYRQSKKAATLLLDGAGSGYDFTWQPLYDGSAGTGDIEFVGSAIVDEWSTMRDTSVAALPPDVTDYSDLLSSEDALVFYDLMHLNERGARLVATEWYERLQPRLERLAQNRE